MAIHAGALNKRVTFRQRVDTPDTGGGFSSEWKDELIELANFRPERGAERLQAGRITATLAGLLTVRSSAATRAIDETQSVMIDGEPYQIRSISNPDQRDHMLEMSVERGSAL